MSGYVLRALFLIFLPFSMYGQTSLKITSEKADSAVKGLHNPADYTASSVLNHPDSIVQGVLARVSADSLHLWLETLGSFSTRNTASDTLSATRGIGAARNWAHSTFERFSAQNENRLLVSFFEFDLTICSVTHHKNVIAVLPGMDTSNHEVILIEAHLDAMCKNVCDTSCVAKGADDNGSGSSLVIELARVLSRYSFNQTMIFMLTIGEEQGLYGSDAFADYMLASGVKMKAVLNNDIVGGITCGNTASPPGCPGAGHIDSLNVRLFSYGGFNSLHKGLVRFIKLEYEEELAPIAPVPMTLHVMTNEDRGGRGGDHIPFRQKNFTAMRFTCANEHGNGNPVSGYTDHQHTSEDSLGVDTDFDGEIDSFYVDFNYLARNAVINGNAAGLLGIGPVAPGHSIAAVSSTEIEVTFTSAFSYPAYRVGVRTTTNDFDSVYTVTGPVDTISGLAPGVTYLISAASVDSNGIESKFTNELLLLLTERGEASVSKGVELLPNRPNPFDEYTLISVRVDKPVKGESYISVTTEDGRELQRLPVTLNPGLNEVAYYHGFHATGVYLYSLVMDGVVMETRRMVFVN